MRSHYAPHSVMQTPLTQQHGNSQSSSPVQKLPHITTVSGTPSPLMSTLTVTLLMLVKVALVSPPAPPTPPAPPVPPEGVDDVAELSPPRRRRRRRLLASTS